MPLILGANSVSGYTVKNSLRFNSGSSDNLTKTFGTATSRRIFTISTWVKRSALGSVNNIFTAGVSGTGDAGLRFPGSGDELSFYQISNPYSAYDYSIVTTQVFRDVSAWYHILIGFDSTQATSSNRIKMYVNGSQVTSLSSSSYPSQNFDGYINNNISHKISGAVDTTFGNRFFDGYISETYFIDGQALTPSSFGETDTLSGIWIPKAYTGTYGTNGFYLKFANSASLGTDSSGNGNTFTVNNLTSVDQSTDTPTNNFCTLSSIDIDTACTAGVLTEGNLQLAHSSGANGSHTIRRGTIAVNKGKWYSEYKIIDIGSGTDRIGIINIAESTYQSQSNPYLGVFPTAYGYLSNGKKENNDSSSSYGATYTTGDIIGVALDCDNGTLVFYKNGTSQGTAFSGLDTSLYYTFSSSPYNNQTGSHNFGSPAYSANSYTDGAGYGNFSYAVPSGFYSLCTKNLSTQG